MQRKNIIYKNVSQGLLFKVMNMGIVYLTIPILLDYLDVESYGLWVTIFSVVNIVFYLDMGIVNGLKTKLTESISLNNFALAREYISNTYLFISTVALIILIVGSILIFFLDLQYVLNTNVNETLLKKVFFVSLLMISTSFILSSYKAFYYAIQKSRKVEFALLLYQILVLTSLLIVQHYLPKSLFLVALIYGFSNIFISLLFTIFFFKTNIHLKPSIKLWSTKNLNNLIGLSLEFFVIQICIIIIYTTDNIIISNLLGPSEVTSYDIVYKLFQVAIVLSIIAQDAFWPLYTDAYKKNDINWIKQTLLRFNKLFIPFVILVIILAALSKSIIGVWIGKNLQISNTLILFMTVFVIIRVYGIIYMNFLNGIGKVRLQLKLYLFGAIINIPLSIFFVTYFDLGSSGVILGTIFSISLLTLLMPIQTHRILKMKANANTVDLPSQNS